MDFQKLKLKKEIILIFILAFIIFFIYLIPIRIAHWWDETVYLQNAEVLFSGRTNYDEFSFRPPLLSILFFLIFFIKHSPISASVLTAALSVLAPIFTFLIGKKIYGLKTGAIAGAIFAFSPFTISNSNYLLTDVPVVSLLAISFYFLLFRERKKFLFFSGAFLSLAILMKFTALILGAVFLFYFFIKRFNLKEIVLFATGFFLILLPYLLWAQIKFGFFLYPFIKGSSMVAGESEGIFFYIENFSQAFTILSIFGLVVWFSNFVYNQISKRKLFFKSEDKHEIVLFFWIVFFLAYISYIPHKELRYIFPMSMPVVILASKGIVSIFNRFKKPFNIFIIILLFGQLFWFTFASFPKDFFEKIQIIDYTENEVMKASKYIINKLDYNGTIYANHNWPVFAYYTELKTIPLWPYTSLFYEEYTSLMREKGLLIVEKGIDKYPRKEWLDKNPDFRFVSEEGIFYFYEYLPS
jgi:4-amino-4-deoxy-L-arabinose transferase-like glycosyltransferase